MKENDIFILLGAGCSREAGIITANEMVTDIETKIQNDTSWQPFESLYNYIKSSILFSEGIFGNFSNTFSIEKLLNVLTELEKKEKNIIYPFIANWNNRLIELADKNFDNIKKLRKEIFDVLVNQWIKVDNYDTQASYFSNFYKFQREFQFPLRIFSLNYDLCLEKANIGNSILELGFDENKLWNSYRFEINPNNNVDIFLYKLHGSINWKKNQAGIIQYTDEFQSKPDIIFGTDTKLQSIDPYLFLVYEFRKYSLNAKVIIVIGYSFSDNYINNLLQQALKADPNRKILCVSRNDDTKKSEFILQKLECDNKEQLVIIKSMAKQFLNDNMNLTFLEPYIAKKDDVFQ